MDAYVTLRTENAALREKLESHAPEGHNVTNEQYVKLREERDALRVLVKEGRWLVENVHMIVEGSGSASDRKWSRKSDAFLRKAREVGA